MDTVVVNCHSHRARRKLLQIAPDAAPLFSMRRNSAGGFYRITANHLTEARAITGVTKTRDAADLMNCWKF